MIIVFYLYPNKCRGRTKTNSIRFWPHNTVYPPKPSSNSSGPQNRPSKQEGVSGFFKGLATGAFGAIAVTLTGAVAGATQIARGVYNTPEAVAVV